jgi:hypothetical protein
VAAIYLFQEKKTAKLLKYQKKVLILTAKKMITSKIAYAQRFVCLLSF